jgi:hypothetical protein
LEIFRQEYAPKYWCFNAEAINSESLQAGASNGLVTFSGFANTVTSDAEIASVMAHELAHVTLQSEDPEILKLKRIISKRLYEQYDAQIGSMKEMLRTDYLDENEKREMQLGIEIYENERAAESWAIGNPVPLSNLRWVDYEKFGYDIFFERLRNKKIPQLEILISKYDRHYGSTRIDFESFSKKIESSLGRAETWTWREMEADLIGLINYLKAGFAPEQYLEYRKNHAVKEGIIDLGRCFDTSKEPPPVLYDLETETTHPSDCFRIWRVSVELNQLKYQGFKFGKIVNLGGLPNLTSVQREGGTQPN